MSDSWSTSASAYNRCRQTDNPIVEYVQHPQASTYGRTPLNLEGWRPSDSFTKLGTNGQYSESVASSDSSWGWSSSAPPVHSATTPAEQIVTWPPIGLTKHSTLSHDEAVTCVTEGAVCFHAVVKPANHAMEHHLHVYPSLSMVGGIQILEASPDTTAAGRMSFSLNGDVENTEAWDTLEQPSMTLCFGKFPGTMTLNRYIGNLNRPAASFERTAKAMLRKIDLSQILGRLKTLQDARDVPFEITGREASFLYGQLVLDPEPDYTQGLLEREIDLLSSLLSSPIWIILQQIAQPGRGKVAWSMVLARKFLRNVTFEKLGNPTACSGKCLLLVPRDKEPQLTEILNVGYALEWPSMDQVKARMQIESEGKAMQFQWSPPSSTFLAGITLPGSSVSWTILSCLLDCSPSHRKALAGLEEMRPQSGFQYLEHTYWYWESIVGKVLGAMPGLQTVAGWIGPCIYTSELEKVQYVRIYQKQTEERMKKRDRRTIAARSDPLGLPDVTYRVGDFALVLPNLNKTVESIRVEKLVSKIHLDPTIHEPDDLIEHDVALQFSLHGVSWPVRLRYDVSFIAAAACWAGPHVLYREYAYKAVSVEKLIYNFEWAGWDGVTDSPMDSPDEEDDDTVLLVEAYGVADNAVFARTCVAHQRYCAGSSRHAHAINTNCF
ncbi:MAG: hypothetical protein Q9179_004147 [Wetmoreana sp. 5 TL-2023]